jgi:hypothetical protein
MNLLRFNYQCRRFQEMVLVLFSLNTMGGIRSKEEVLRYIRGQGWLASTQEDRASYEGSREPKSETLLCYARKDAVEAGLMFDHDERDHWEIAREGQSFLEHEKRHFGRSCYVRRIVRQSNQKKVLNERVRQRRNNQPL